MTIQVKEILFVEQKKYYMGTHPSIPDDDPRILKTPQPMISTGCWRGYVGTWKIRNYQLFLIKIEGNHTIVDGDPILADWFSGVLDVPLGEDMKTCFSILHCGRMKYITILNGNVVKIELTAVDPNHWTAQG